MCLVCDAPLTGRQQRVCSQRCRAKRVHQVHPQNGSGNHNFKGWRSKNHVVYTRAFKLKHPDKVKAHRKLAAAIRAGVIQRPSACQSCLRSCRPDAHHDDHAYPMRVQWLCRKCHVARDRQLAHLKAHASDDTAGVGSRLAN